RLLRYRLGRYGAEISFHNELTDIFTGLRDLHTNYLLPDYFAKAAAFLPFRLKASHDNAARTYILTGTMTGLADPNSTRGRRLPGRSRRLAGTGGGHRPRRRRPGISVHDARRLRRAGPQPRGQARRVPPDPDVLRAPRRAVRERGHPSAGASGFPQGAHDPR